MTDQLNPWDHGIVTIERERRAGPLQRTFLSVLSTPRHLAVVHTRAGTVPGGGGLFSTHNSRSQPPDDT